VDEDFNILGYEAAFIDDLLPMLWRSFLPPHSGVKK